MSEVKDLQSILSSDFMDSDSSASDLESVIAVLERHGFPMQARQVKAIAYVRSLCPDSDLINNVIAEYDRGRFHCISPDLFLEALAKATLADKVTGRIPLSKAFDGGGD